MIFTISLRFILWADKIKDDLLLRCQEIDKKCKEEQIETIHLASAWSLSNAIRICNQRQNRPAFFQLLVILENELEELIFRLENDTDEVVPQVSKDFFVSLEKLFCELLFENYTRKELIAYINNKHSIAIGYQHFLGDFLLAHANKNNIDLGLKVKYTLPLLPLQYADSICHIDSASSPIIILDEKENKPPSEATNDIDNVRGLKRTHSQSSTYTMMPPKIKNPESLQKSAFLLKNYAAGASDTPTTLKGHASLVLSFVVLPNGQLASGSWDCSIEVWDVKQKQCVATLAGETSPVMSLVVLSNGQLASGSWDSSIKVWDIEQKQCVATLTGHTMAVYTLVVLPNGQLASGSYDKSIKVWDVVNQVCVSTLVGHTHYVTSLVLLLNGQLASSSYDKSIKVWDVVNQVCVSTLVGHTHYVTSLVLLLNGQLASSSYDKSIKVWDVVNQVCLATLTGHMNSVWRLVVLPNGQLASGSYDKSIKVWDVVNQVCVATLRGHTNSVWSLVVLPNGQLASGSQDNSIKVWDFPWRMGSLFELCALAVRDALSTGRLKCKGKSVYENSAQRNLFFRPQKKVKSSEKVEPLLPTNVYDALRPFR